MKMEKVAAGRPLGEMLTWAPVRGAEAVKKICWVRAWWGVRWWGGSGVLVVFFWGGSMVMGMVFVWVCGGGKGHEPSLADCPGWSRRIGPLWRIQMVCLVCGLLGLVRSWGTRSQVRFNAGG